jgi:hypothetical protein
MLAFNYMIRLYAYVKLIQIHHKDNRKNEQHTESSRIKFFIELQQIHNRSTEVTALPPSFDYWNGK